MDASDLSTSCTVLLAIVGIMILYRIASPMTKYHWTDVVCDDFWLVVLYDIYELGVRDFHGIKKMCDASDYFCHYHRAGAEVSESSDTADLEAGRLDQKESRKTKNSSVNVAFCIHV